MQHLLIIRFSALGDVAMMVPVIRALVFQYPKVKVTVVSRPFFEPMFKDIPNVSFFGADVSNHYKGLSGLRKLYNELKKRNIDVVADLHFVLRSRILSSFFKFSGIPVASLDKGRKEKKSLTRKKNKVFQPLKHMSERHTEVLEKLGFIIDLKASAPIKKSVMSPSVIRFTGEKKDTWIGIAPFAQYPSKIYPSDLMKEVVSKLAEHKTYHLFLFGGSSELADLKHIQQNLPNVLIVAGKLSFEEELNIIQNLDGMLAMDSGNAHLAAMYGIPTITLWGNTHPFAGFTPFGQPLDHSLTANREIYPEIPTSVYGNKLPKGYEDVMRTISVESVVDKISRCIS